MPTQRPRHTITEVGRVEDALGRVRAVQGGDVDLRELIVLGAEVAVDRARQEAASEERRAVLRRRLIERIGRPGEFDLEAAEAVREHGWVREQDV